MHRAFLVLLCLVPVLACNLADQNKNSQNIVDSTRPTPSPGFSPAQSPSPSATPPATTAPTIGSILKRSVGKYPYEIKLLDNPEVNARLQKLMGKDLAAMKQNWNVESPIEISGSKLKTSGCEQHNCGDNMYVMFVDLENDNINIYHLNGEPGTKTYFEKGKIILPPKFADEVHSETQDNND